MKMNRSDKLFLYTDGLTEAENERHDQYGEQRMIDNLTAMNDLRPHEIVERMEKSVKEFAGEAPQSDDLTMLAIRYQTPAIVMRNDIQQIPTLAEWIDDLKLPQALNMPINLALEEAVTNVMMYAYPGRNDGQVFVEYTEAESEKGKKLIFTISDSGIPFDPTQKAEVDTSLPAEEREIGGLGIHLVRQLMDEVRYERDEGKNILTLVKNI
jgi:sigma-B regulation protein RsbU (phosphoserine phosphatase)